MIKRRLFMALIAGVSAAASSQDASVDKRDSYRL